MNWETARKQALARDGERCRRCAKPATDVHHRKAKGMGGTCNTDTLYGLANLVSLCRDCHSWVHAHPWASYEAGWLVHSRDDPAGIPVPGGGRYDF